MFSRKLLFVVFVFVQISSIVSKETCIGSYCYDIEPACNGLSFSLSYDGQTIINQQLDITKPTCQTIYQDCQWCANATVIDDVTHYCYETRNCQGATMNGKCWDVNTNCNNHGKCLVGGLCKCDEGYHGYDCSVLLKDNCLETEKDKLCWRLQFPDCNTVDFELSRPSGVILRQNTSMSSGLTFPCQTVPNIPNCNLCVVINNLAIMGDTMTGTPTVTVCGRKYELGTVPLVKSSRLSNCPSTALFVDQPPDTTANSESGVSQNNEPQSDTGKTVLLVLASLLGLLFLGVIGYFVISKYGPPFDTSTFPNPFQDVEVYTEDDVAPLKQNDNSHDQ